MVNYKKYIKMKERRKRPVVKGFRVYRYNSKEDRTLIKHAIAFKYSKGDPFIVDTWNQMLNFVKNNLMFPPTEIVYKYRLVPIDWDAVKKEKRLMDMIKEANGMEMTKHISHILEIKGLNSRLLLPIDKLGFTFDGTEEDCFDIIMGMLDLVLHSYLEEMK